MVLHELLSLERFLLKMISIQKDLQSGKFCSFKVKHQPINHVKIEYSVFETFIIISRSLSWQTNWREENFIYTAKRREHRDSGFWVVMTRRRPGWLGGKELACQSRRHRFDPWARKTLWRGNGIPIQHSFPGNPMDRGAWRAVVTKTRTWMSTHVT